MPPTDQETGVGTSPPSISTWTDSPVVEITVQLTDPEGERAITRSWWKTYATGAVAMDNTPIGTVSTIMKQVASDIQGMSNAQVTDVAFTFRSHNSFVKPPEPATGTDDIEDKAFIELASASGGLIKMNVATPTKTTFLSDGETVDPVGGDAVPLLGDMIGGQSTTIGANAGGTATWYATDKNGVQSNSYIKGYYRRAKTRRTLRQGISTEIGG